jgi:hypothetical protein
MSADARINAHSEFDRARRQAERDRLTAWLQGRDARLLPFDVIRRNLRQQSPLYRGIQQVPLDLIVGSVGRYVEMTREFLPLNDSLKDRWVKVATLAQSEGWPPIELYKAGNVYFVRDGNHRVSAARQLKFPSIEAHVWEYPDEIEIGPKDSLDDVLNRFRERVFLEKTGLHLSQPTYNIRFTTSGRYPELQAQIEDLRQKLELIDEREVSFEEAANAWYELIYLPAVQIIRESGLLDAFPGRTEADLFAWMSLHRENLRARYGDFESLAALVQNLMETYRERPAARASRRMRRLLGSDELPPLAGLDELPEDNVEPEGRTQDG